MKIKDVHFTASDGSDVYFSCNLEIDNEKLFVTEFYSNSRAYPSGSIYVNSDGSINIEDFNIGRIPETAPFVRFLHYLAENYLSNQNS